MTAGQHLSVATDRTDPVVLVTAAGELDASTVAKLDEAIDAAIGGTERHVVVDLSGITFVDSTGITALIGALRRLNRARRRLALALGTGGPVSRALELTGLDHTFECHPTASAAEAALSGAPLIGR